MNGQPKQLLVSIAMSNRFTLEAIEEIYKGIYAACKRYDVDLVGGDTTSSNTGLVLSLTVLGSAPEADVVYRKGAKPTDLLVVSGDLGGAYMGLQVLEREKEVYKVNPNMQPELKGHEYILERQLKPEARRDVIETLEGLKIKPTSMIDISDGLSSEIMHLCKQSGVGARLYEEKIPIDPSVYTVCEEMNLNTTTVALGGGEDYELLFTAPIEEHEKIQANPNLTIIGHITDASEGVNMVTRADQLIELTAQGWNALKEEE
jgi:thiamine-monophosphate kinase